MISLLHYEARVKPEIKALVDRVDELTDEDIENAVVPLPWFRQALKLLRDQNAHNRNMDEIAKRANAIADLAIHSTAPDPLGHIAVWTDGDSYVFTSAQAQFLMTPGMLVWFPDSGGVWIGTLFTKYIDPRLAALPRGDHISKSEFSRRCYDRMQKLL